MQSFIDSLCVNSFTLFSPGLYTSFYMKESGAPENVELFIDGEEIKTQMDSSAKRANEYLIERESKVLLLYQTSPLWEEAWQRYYRMIFKDSCKRLQKVSFDIYTALAPKCADETAFAQKILSWTQGFKYERERTASDFASLPAVIMGGGSDCDSRALLIAVILQSADIDSVIFVSAEYSHAVAGLHSDHPGFGFYSGEKLYLTGETTVEGLTWGLINRSQSDSTKWICVNLP